MGETFLHGIGHDTFDDVVLVPVVKIGRPKNVYFDRLSWRGGDLAYRFAKIFEQERFADHKIDPGQSVS